MFSHIDSVFVYHFINNSDLLSEFMFRYCVEWLKRTNEKKTGKTKFSFWNLTVSIKRVDCFIQQQQATTNTLIWHIKQICECERMRCVCAHGACFATKNNVVRMLTMWLLLLLMFIQRESSDCIFWKNVLYSKVKLRVCLC